MKNSTTILVVIALTGFALVVKGDVYIDTSVGTASPPGVFSGYPMFSFPNDVRSEFDIVSEVAPATGFAPSLLFSQPMELDFVGSGWNTWSHGYSGAVYQLYEQAVSGVTGLMLTMPLNTCAFYTYLQPNQKDVYDFTVSSATESKTVSISGDSGAQFVGFWTDDPADPILSIRLDQPDGNALGFAIGEFGIGAVGPVPDVASCWNGLLALVALGLFGWRARRPQ